MFCLDYTRTGVPRHYIFLNILPYCGIWNNQFTVGVNKPLSPIFLHNNETIFFGCPGFTIYIIELKGKTAYNALKSSSVISCKINLSVKIIKFIHSSILLQISVIPSRTTIQRLTLTYTQFFKTTHLYWQVHFVLCNRVFHKAQAFYKTRK